MSKRFTALHRSNTECRKAVDKKKSPVQWPKTMSSLERTETSRYRTMDSFDNLPLNHQETAFLSKTIPNYRSQDFTLR
uniref:Uncharacterized protein n=1 Tax=Caenorhabditis japonica TaxID=281687 RepID=A0A8R1ERI5_CAEJA